MVGAYTGLIGRGSHHTGTEVGLTEKGSHARVQGHGTRYKPAKTANIKASLPSAGDSKFMLRAREGNGSCLSLCPSNRMSLRRVIKLPLVCPKCSSHHHAVCPGVICLPSLQKHGSALRALSQQSPLSF